MSLPICVSICLILVIGSFIKVNFIFLKENEGKLQISVLSLQLSVMLQLVQNLKFKKSYFA